MSNRRTGRDSGSSSRNRSQKSRLDQQSLDWFSDPAAAAHSRPEFSRQPRELALCRDGIGVVVVVERGRARAKRDDGKRQERREANVFKR